MLSLLEYQTQIMQNIILIARILIQIINVKVNITILMKMWEVR